MSTDRLRGQVQIVDKRRYQRPEVPVGEAGARGWSGAPREPLLLFDGECPVCTASVARVTRFLGAGKSSGSWEPVAYEFVDLPALNAWLGRRGAVTAEELVQHGPVWVTPSGKLYSGVAAGAHLLMRVGGAWAYLGGLLALPPVRRLLTAAGLPLARHYHPTQLAGVL